MAFATGGRIGPGTARTMVEGLAGGGRVRTDGQIVAVPIAWKTMSVPFRNGPQPAVTIPWGDVAAAWHTTGIPNIEVYAAMPQQQIDLMRRFRWLFSLLKVPGIGRLLGCAARKILRERTVLGSQADRASVWGRVTDGRGLTMEATLETPEAYRLTVLTALAAVERLLSQGVPPGFATPARAFGSQFILRITDTDVRWEKS